MQSPTSAFCAPSHAASRLIRVGAGKGTQPAGRASFLPGNTAAVLERTNYCPPRCSRFDDTFALLYSNLTCVNLLRVYCLPLVCTHQTFVPLRENTGK